MENDEDSSDMEVENILQSKPKKIKSGQKGKRVERELVGVLNDRFDKILKKNPDWGRFSRSVGSGNRWGQSVYLSHAATGVYSGDITCPTNFLFVIESKGGYNEIDLNAAFDGGCKELDDFLSQVEDDSKRCGRKPMLIWKKDRKPRLAFTKRNDMDIISKIGKQPEYRLQYRDWQAVNLDDLLVLPDEFFFSSEQL